MKNKLNQPDIETTTTIPNITIEKVTPEQFISGIKGYIERLENENGRLKKIVKENEYTINQLKRILNSPVLEETKDE